MKKLLLAASFFIAATSYSQPYFGEKGEPVKGILLGAGQSDYASDRSNYGGAYNEFAKVIGQQPALFMDYIPVSQPLVDQNTIIGLLESIPNRFARIKAAMPKGVRLQLGVTFNGGTSIADYGKPIAKDITAGIYDKNLLAIGDGLNSLGDTCFVRLGHEFDLKANNQLGQDYVKAYRRAFDLISSRCKKVVFVWCSAGGSAARWKDSVQMLKSYPGDAYVNWFGGDVFDFSEWESEGLRNFLALARSHKKLFMVGETTPRGVGVLKGKESWDKWFAPMLKCLQANPIIKSICYINWDWKAETAKRSISLLGMTYGATWGSWGDARIEKSPYIAATLKAGLQSLSAPSTAYDTIPVKVEYWLNIKVTHDTLVKRDSIRYETKPRTAFLPFSGTNEDFEILDKVAAILNRKRAK